MFLKKEKNSRDAMTKSSKSDPHTKSVFLVTDNRVFTGHSIARCIRSPAPLNLLTRSTALHYAPLASLAHSIHGLAPCLTVEICEYVFTRVTESMVKSEFSVPRGRNVSISTTNDN